ncbi:MAG: hypothetical protein KDI01_03040 [Halioglobus sp.]|nr:hypothetical protein [Halioglobus sp.]
MKRIHLAFKSYDAHELLCHAIAAATDLYRAADLSVTLLDATFVPEDALPDNSFQSACSSALIGYLRGQSHKIVFTACDKPMFWLYGRPGIDSLAQLQQARVATFPDAAAPARLLQRFLADAGVAPGLLPSRDDTARLALVSSGSVDAALLGALYLPHVVRERGVRQLAWIGATLRLPSTGLAVSGELYAREPGLVAQMVDIYQRSLQYVYDSDESVLRCVLTDAFAVRAHELDQAVATIRECYNERGYSQDSLLRAALDGVASGMGLRARPAEDLFEFDTIKSNY